MKKYTFSVSGMHCPSCEVLIERKLIELPEVEAVDASTSRKEVTIYHNGERPSLESLNNALKDQGYCLSEECVLPGKEEKNSNPNQLLTSIGIAVAVFLIFLGLNRLGLSSLVNVSAASSLPAFILFGLLAGVSTCAALVGGIVLSMSEEWKKGYANGDSLVEKMKPHFLFNLGRLASYSLFGFVLGAVGSKLQLSLTFGAFLVIAVSALMIGNGLKMLGVKALQNFQIGLPKSLTHKTSNQKNFQGRFMPAIMGALTILLPCGFTITTESLALLSGNPMQGALIMAAFALGTLPGLLAIGFSAVKIENSPRSAIFTKVAGALVLMFAVFNINSQLNVLGFTGINTINAKTTTVLGSKTETATDGLPEVVDGKQVIKMEASSSGYSPNYFKVRPGIPIRWEITDIGTSGCTNAVISRGLFEGQIDLKPGSTSVKEFTVQKPGKYRFSCWMGMITGVIEVVNQNGSVNSAATSAQEIPSGAKGCGCGGGGGSSCGVKK